MAVEREKLPELIYLEDYNGDYKSFINAVYAVFERDFVKSQPEFGGQQLRHKKHPAFQDRPYTFYHMTHKGEIESERTPDLRRCERMPWARPTIEQTETLGIKFWEQERDGNHRVCIWLEVDDGDNYFIILDVRKTFVLLWTAFHADYHHQIRKKQKEYEEWKERVCNKNYTPAELVMDIMSRIQ